MNTIEDDFILDLSASCTKDQAVMRMLGWGRLTMYPRAVHLLADGTLKEDSKEVFRPDFSLNELLSEMYRNATNAYLHSVPLEATQEEANRLLEKAIPNIERAELMIELAREYLIDIVDELALGPASALRVDKEMSDKTGELHITLKSLDAWSKAKEQRDHSDDADDWPTEEDDPTMGALNKPISKMSKTEIGLYTVLGLVTEAYAKDLGETYFSKSGEVNIKQAAIAVAGHAATYMESDKAFPGQSFATVKARLTAAEKCLAHAKKWNFKKSTNAKK
jgi:hypothetical protein